MSIETPVMPIDSAHDLEVHAAPAHAETDGVPPVESTELDSKQKTLENAKQFAVHVNYVRENGDILDCSGMTGKLAEKVERGAYKSAAVVALTSVAGPTAFIFNALTMVTVAGRRAYKLYKMPLEYRRSRNMHDDQKMPGEIYELYSVKDENSDTPEIAMRWYGQHGTGDDNKDTPSSRAESLQAIAKLARKNDIKVVFIGTEELADVPRESAALASAVVLVEPWLERRKGMKVEILRDKKPVYQQMYAFTPGNLERFAAGLQHETTDAPSPATLIAALRKSVPEHPLVMRYDCNLIVAKGDQTSLRATAGQCLAQRIDKINIRNDRSNPAAPRKTRQYLDPKLDGGTVRWHVNNQLQESSDLLHELGISDSRLKFMQTHMDTLHAKDLALITEYTLYTQVLHQDKMASKKRIVDTVAHETPPLQTLLIHESVNQVYVRNKQKRRNKIADAVFIGVFALTLATQSNGNAAAIQEAAVAEQGYASEHGTAADKLSIAQRIQARQAIKTPNAFTDLYVHDRQYVSVPIETGISYLADKSRDFENLLWGTKKNEVPGSYISSRIGNVILTNQDYTPNWHAEGRGMDTAGYWAQRTSSVYEKNQWNGTDQISNLREMDIVPRLSDLPTPQQAIFVSRPLRADDMGFKLKLFDNPIPSTVFSIPVLEGTRPIAASYGTSQVAVLRAMDNTYLLALVGEEIRPGTQLTYALAPDSTSVPMSQYFNKIISSTNEHDDDRATRQKILDIWDRQVPYRKGAGNPYEIRKQERAEYIRENFTYSLAPLPEITALRQAVGNLPADELVFESFKIRKAVCNTANTILALGDSELNTAWGYRDDGDGELRGAERHLWTIDWSGKIFDGTPSIPEYNQDIWNTPVKIALGSLGLPLASYLVVAGVRRRRQRAPEQRLHRYSSRKLQEIREVANMAAYRPAFDLQAIPIPDVSLDSAAALRQLRSPRIQSDFVSSRVDQAIGEAGSYSAKRKLKMTRRALVDLKRAGMVDVVSSPDNLEAVL